MKNGLAILDSGPIFSLAALNQLSLLDNFFDEIRIPMAVWKEVTLNPQYRQFSQIESYFADKVHNVIGTNQLILTMDYGEYEALLLYREMSADFLIIDDRKARKIAESNKVQCIGTLGLLTAAKTKGLILELRPLFLRLLERKRFFAISLLNQILSDQKEQLIELKK